VAWIAALPAIAGGQTPEQAALGPAADGRPTGGLVRGPDGSLYGTTDVGGRWRQGSIFALRPNRTGYRFSTLHHFEVGESARQPFGDLVLAADGYLYGTSFAGGRDGCGSIFRIRTDGNGFSIVHSFSGGDGAAPYAGLTLGGDGHLYGTTYGNGVCGDLHGSVFRVSTDGSTFATVHTFDGADGALPRGGVVESDGVLYGTTSGGGPLLAGSIFSVQTNGDAFTTLRSFAPEGDGASPWGLLLEGDTLYGTAITGGALGRGTVFAMSRTGTDFEVLHAFAGTDGAAPARLLLHEGVLYGTTFAGGPADRGLVYRISTSGSGFETLHLFGEKDGAVPNPALVLNDGILYGTTWAGGREGIATAFKLSTEGFGFARLHTFRSGGRSSPAVVAGEIALDGTVAAADSEPPPDSAHHTIVIDGTNDFAADEDVPGTSGSTWYFTWDATNFYFGLSAPDVDDNLTTKSVVLYVDTDPRQTPLSGNGTATGRTYNTQTPGLAFHADYHFRWRTDSGSTDLLAWNSGSSSWDPASTSGIQASGSGTFVEFAIPRANLGSPTQVYVVGAMINEQTSSESTSFLTPQANGPDGFDPDFAHYFGFPLVDQVSPDLAGNVDTYPLASVASGSFSSGATWTGGAPPHGNSNVFIQNGHAVTLDATGDLKHLTVLSGGTFNGSSQTLNVSNQGLLTTAGTFNPGTGTLFFAGAGTVSGATSFNHVVISNSVDFGAASTANGTLLINTGGFVNTNAPTYGPASTLQYNTGGTYNATAEWTAGASSGQGVPYNVQVSNNTALNLSSQNRTARGTLTIISLSTVSATSGTLSIMGGFSKSGTFVHNNGTVAFTGTTNQSLGGSSPTTFFNMAVNNPAGVTLSTDVTTANLLTLTSGNVTTGASRMIIGPSGSVSRTSGHIVGNLRKTVPAGGSVARAFEVGTTAYSPVTVSFASVGVADTLTASAADGDHPAIGASTLNAAKSVNRTWTLTPGGPLAFTTATATFEFVSGDLDLGTNTSNLIVGRFSGGAWSYPTVGTRTLTSTQATGLTSLSDFQLAEPAVAGVTISESGGGTNVTEGGATDTYTIVLNSVPTASVTISFNTGSQIPAIPSVTFTTGNALTPQTITVAAVDDMVVEGAHSGVISHSASSADSGYNGIAIASVTANITDNDTAAAGVTIVQSGGSTNVTEGGATDTYTVVLNSVPTANVTISFNTGTQVQAIPSVVFTTANALTPQTITVAAVDDMVAEGAHSGVISHSASSADSSYNGIAIASVTANITDNDTAAAGVTIVQSGGSTNVTEGGATDTYTVVLNSVPTANVTISFNTGSQIQAIPSVTFTTGNALTPQTITVAAVDDMVVEGAHSGVISHSASSADSGYNGIAIASVTANITDNDTAAAEFVFISNGLIEVNQNQDSKGDVHANGRIEFDRGAPGTHVGNLEARGNIEIDRRNTIQGDVRSGGSISLASGSVITGTRTPHTTVHTIPMPTLSYSAGGTNVTVPVSGTRTLTPGSYGTVKVSRSGTLFLSPGSYFMTSLDTDANAVLSINAGGPVNIHVVGGLDIDNGVRINLTAGTSNNVLITSKQTNKVQVKANAILFGNLVVPRAEVHFDAGSRIKGAVIANSITLDQRVKFYSHSATGF
jgi:uncharacterized repeat protein (TIGR03803 family)